MKTQPNNPRWRKLFERFPAAVDHTRHLLHHGEFGLKAVAPYPHRSSRSTMMLTAPQIETMRRALMKKLRDGPAASKTKVRIWARVFPDRTLTKLPLESGMGKGKGAVEMWAAAVRPGVVIFEWSDSSVRAAEIAAQYAADRAPFKVKLVRRPRMELDDDTRVGLAMMKHEKAAIAELARRGAGAAEAAEP